VNYTTLVEYEIRLNVHVMSQIWHKTTSSKKIAYEKCIINLTETWWKENTRIWHVDISLRIILICRDILSGPGKCFQYRYSLGTGKYGDQIPVEVRFSRNRPHRTRGPLSLLQNVYHVSFLQLERRRCGVYRQRQSSAKIKERRDLYLHSPSGPSWQVIGWGLHFTLTCIWVHSLIWSIPLCI
jgi:hypothetical protein